MKKQIEQATAVIVGTALWTCRRTTDLVSFHFGEKRQTKTFRGEPAEVGEYAINVQCAWRIAREDRVWVGSGDFYYPSDIQIERTPPGFDWSTGPNRCDMLLRLLFEDERRKFVVRTVEVGAAGNLRIIMDSDLSLEILPNDSLSDEYWRIFSPSAEHEHFVVSGKRLAQMNTLDKPR